MSTRPRSWIVTVPKTVPWASYARELAAVADGTSVMNYRVRFFPKGMAVGDRCYVVHDGRVRGWMEVVGLEERLRTWQCSSTGAVWPPGRYVQRSGVFHEVDGPAYVGFQGVRSYDPGVVDQ